MAFYLCNNNPVSSDDTRVVRFLNTDGRGLRVVENYAGYKSLIVKRKNPLGMHYIDVSSYDGYKNLTEDNFILGRNTYGGGGSGGAGSSDATRTISSIFLEVTDAINAYDKNTGLFYRYQRESSNVYIGFDSNSFYLPSKTTGLINSNMGFLDEYNDYREVFAVFGDIYTLHDDVDLSNKKAICLGSYSGGETIDIKKILPNDYRNLSYGNFIIGKTSGNRYYYDEPNQVVTFNDAMSSINPKPIYDDASRFNYDSYSGLLKINEFVPKAEIILKNTNGDVVYDKSISVGSRLVYVLRDIEYDNTHMK